MDFHIHGIGIYIIYVLIFFLAIAIRYFIAAGIFYAYFYRWNSKKFENKKLSKRKLRKGQLKKEIFWSLKSSLIFALIGTLTYWLWERDLTAIYLDPSFLGYWYLPVSLVLVLFFHETYYYWVHRWMHEPKVFRKVHKVHHDSLTPTPWTAFSFHPWESLIEALILPVIIIFIPMNIFVLVFYLLLMTISSVVNHLGIEIFSKRFRENWFGSLFINATHHHYHHEEFSTNYGLYFTFWDKWMKTESKKLLIKKTETEIE